MRALGLCGLLLVSGLKLPAQSWKTALLVATETSLLIDYAQVKYGLDHGSPSWVFGKWKLNATSLAIANLTEAAINAFAPKKYRPYINAATLAFHLVVIPQTARRPIGYLDYRGGFEVARIGFRIWP